MSRSLGTFYLISRHVAIEEHEGEYFLTDGRRFVSYPSFDAALADKSTQQKLQFGEELDNVTQ